MNCQKILVVDDEVMIHRLVEARLKSMGVEIISHDRGRDAIDVVKREQPDLILLDIHMPDMTGFDVIKQLKADAESYNIPVIFLTGSDSSEKIVQGFNLGAVDYVTKPFDTAVLSARVRAALNSKAMMDMLMTQAQLDGLTGLHNRRYFDQRLLQELDVVQRYGRQLGLMMLDIDHFKQVNDRFGHPKGDRVLRMVAGLIGETCRTSDIPCRYGGEEFAVLLPQTTAADCSLCARRVLDQVGSCHAIIDLIGQPVTVSVGVTATRPGEVIHPDVLVEQADHALYTAKNQGRNQLVTSFNRDSEINVA